MAVFYNAGGTQFALPDYARTDLAYNQAPNYGPQPLGSHWALTVPAASIYIALTAYATLQTSAVLGNRLVFWEINNPDGNTVSLSPASAVQPAGLVYGYGFASSVGAAYGPVTNYYSVPLPLVAAMPGYTLTIRTQGIDVNDYLVTVGLTFITIPIGPEQTFRSTTAIVTPVLV